MFLRYVLSLCATALLTVVQVDPVGASVVGRQNSYAIIIGSNRAGPGQKQLRYAHADARRVREVLTHLGGYRGDNIQLMMDPGPGQLSGAFATVKGKLAARARKGEASVFLFYYSGHARARALNLGPREVNLQELRGRLLSLPSTVTVAILDACQTGAISRVKGVSPAADFSYNSVNQLNTAGLAVLASSAASELSQETDALRSSYFTHHLVVGLRGAADADGDGGVTLSEAYRYAYNRTLVATASTAVGKQHVTLETKLRGKGEMVLTHPARASSTLVLAAPMAAQVLVSRRANQAVVAELTKAPGKRMALALPRGQYVATVRRGGGRGTVRCQLRLPANSKVALNTTAPGCAPVRQAAVSVKGHSGQTAGHPRWGLELGVGLMLRGHDAYTDRLEDFGFDGNGFTGNRAPTLSAALSYSFTPYVSLVLGYSSLELFESDRRMHDLQDNSARQTFDWWAHGIGLSVRGTLPLANGVFNPYVQAGGGLAWAVTRFTDPLQASVEVDDETHVGFHLGAAAGVNVMPWKNFGFYGQANFTYAPVIDNLLGDTHNSGGPAFYLGLRGAL